MLHAWAFAEVLELVIVVTLDLVEAVFLVGFAEHFLEPLVLESLLCGKAFLRFADETTDQVFALF